MTKAKEYDKSEPLVVPLELIERLAAYVHVDPRDWESMDAILLHIFDAAKTTVIAQGLQDTPKEMGGDYKPYSLECAGVFQSYLDGTYPHKWLNAGLRDMGRIAYKEELEQTKSGHTL